MKFHQQNDKTCVDLDSIFSLKPEENQTNEDLEELNSKSHFCQYCGKKFSKRGKLKKHEKIQHNIEKPYSCKKCQKTFSTLQSLKIHEKKKRACVDLYSTNPFEDHFMSHFLPEISKDILEAKFNPLESVPSLDIEEYDIPYDFLQVDLEGKDSKKFKCQHCDKEFAKKGKLKKHEKIEHNDE